LWAFSAKSKDWKLVEEKTAEVSTNVITKLASSNEKTYEEGLIVFAEKMNEDTGKLIEYSPEGDKEVKEHLSCGLCGKGWLTICYESDCNSIGSQLDRNTGGKYSCKFTAGTLGNDCEFVEKSLLVTPDGTELHPFTSYNQDIILNRIKSKKSFYFTSKNSGLTLYDDAYFHHSLVDEWLVDIEGIAGAKNVKVSDIDSWRYLRINKEIIDMANFIEGWMVGS